MAETVSDFIVQRLYDWGIRRVYGYPGDGINGLFGALRRRQEDVDFIQARHEELAAFMACAHAKFTGEVGVCMATSGPGAIHLLNGLYDAKLDHVPVVAVVGQSATTAIGADYQQEVDLVSLFKDVAHEYVFQAAAPAQVRHLVDQAVRVAQAYRTVTCLVLPHDLQDEPMADPPRKHGATFSGVGYTAPRVVPHDADLRRAADLLNAGSRVAMLVGAGAAGAADEVMQVAERLGAGVAKALLGKDVLPDDLPYVTGAIGLLGTQPSWDLMMQCDTLLMVGTSFPYAEFLPPEGQAKAVQVDLQARKLALRYPVDVPLHGDSRETLRALLPLLQPKTDRAWREEVEDGVALWWRILEERAMNDADPINPQRVFWELSPRLPERAILACDSGSAATWFARDLKIRRGMRASVSGNLATMGCALPYAVAAKFAHPDRPVFALLGDGAMQMNGLNSLVDVARYWERWATPNLVVLVLNNQDLNMVTWEQRVMAGDPKFSGSQDLPPFDYARYAASLGLVGLRMERPDEVADVWAEALSARRPVVVDAVTDPNVPPLPPHVQREQALAYAKAVFKGDPDAWATVVQSMKEVASGYKERLRSIVGRAER